MFDQFVHLVADSSGWAYALIAALALVDAVIPVVPSEAAVITAGVVAAGGDLYLPAVIVAAAAGAFAGDNLAYWIGRRYGTGLTLRFGKGTNSQRRIDWAAGTLRRRGGELITVARFIPGGRTAVALTAGLTRFGWYRFGVCDGLATVIWSVYAASLGYFGGHAFEHQPWKGLLLALVIALVVATGTEAGRWMLRRNRRQGTRSSERSKDATGVDPVQAKIARSGVT